MSRTIALFQTTRSVIKAERICIAANIRCKVIPVPRDISSECGMALEIDSNDIAQTEQLCKQQFIEVKFHQNESNDL